MYRHRVSDLAQQVRKDCTGRESAIWYRSCCPEHSSPLYSQISLRIRTLYSIKAVSYYFSFLPLLFKSAAVVAAAVVAAAVVAAAVVGVAVVTTGVVAAVVVAKL